LHRVGAEDGVCAVRLVPNRRDVEAELLGFDECGELGVGASGETIADAECVFRAFFHNDDSLVSMMALIAPRGDFSFR
jgi:hypothetical protein